jgi:hypothetical protein
MIFERRNVLQERYIFRLSYSHARTSLPTNPSLNATIHLHNINNRWGITILPLQCDWKLESMDLISIFEPFSL